MKDPRCCGTDACVINSEGYCWCGQRWDGKKMCSPLADTPPNIQSEFSDKPQTPSLAAKRRR